MVPLPWLRAGEGELSVKLICLAVVICAVCAGCMAAPKVLLYGPAYPAKPADARIDVYNATRPDVAFFEIAQISCGDTEDDWNMKQILIKAREVGADAVIITGRSGTYGMGVPVGNMVFAAGEDYGLTAIAIRYK
jgi:hypothetical protein